MSSFISETTTTLMDKSKAAEEIDRVLRSTAFSFFARGSYADG
jgi:TPP-dependent 2-oxoacid decarboxylase